MKNPYSHKMLALRLQTERLCAQEWAHNLSLLQLLKFDAFEEQDKSPKQK